MIDILALMVIADNSISPGVVFAIVILLAILVLAVSLWLFRKNLQFRRSMSIIVKRCPYCNAVMQPDASYCPNCGRQVPTVTTLTP